jgi:hypothetical protein
MTRSSSDFDRTMALLASGVSQAETARLTGIPRSTIRTWVKGGPAKSALLACPPCPTSNESRTCAHTRIFSAFTSAMVRFRRTRRGVYRLRVTLDLHYPGIITECQAAMAVVLLKIVGRVDRIGCTDVSSYSKHWPCLFPQHGPGPEHTRPIVLAPWQRDVALEKYPQWLLRGLIHSDGWRGTNVAVTPHGRYLYPRYQFSNRSDDIRAIFAAACAAVGVACRQSNRWNMSVARRDDVARLDQWMGPKR